MPTSRVETFGHLEEQLVAEGKRAGFADASTAIGRGREDAIKAALRDVLPDRVRIDAGSMYDIDDRRAGEIDVMLTDGSLGGVVRLHDGAVAPVSSVVAAVEVKSSLGGGQWEEAVRKITRVKELVRYRPGQGVPGIHFGPAGGDGTVPARAFGFIVAYEAPSWDTLTNKLDAAWMNGDPMTYGPDIVVVLSKGHLVKLDPAYIIKKPEGGDFSVAPGSGLLMIVDLVRAYLQRFTGVLWPTE